MNYPTCNCDGPLRYSDNRHASDCPLAPDLKGWLFYPHDGELENGSRRADGSRARRRFLGRAPEVGLAAGRWQRNNDSAAVFLIQTTPVFSPQCRRSFARRQGNLRGAFFLRTLRIYG
jgi:hypothetical protein